MKAIANTMIRVGLINLPVQICKATDSPRDFSFKQAGPNGEQLRQAYLLPDDRECPKDEIQKGIFQGDEFFPVAVDQIEQIREATKIRELNCEVVEAGEFWSRAHRVSGMYYVQMTKKGGSSNTMRLFVDALEQEGKVLVTKWTPRSVQEQLVIWPKDGILMGSSLTFDNCVREPDEAVRGHLAGVYTDQEMAMAKQLLTALADTSSNSLDMDVDEAASMRDKLVDDVLAGQIIHVPDAPAQPEQNQALAAALAASLAAAGQKVAA